MLIEYLINTCSAALACGKSVPASVKACPSELTRAAADLQRVVRQLEHVQRRDGPVPNHLQGGYCLELPHQVCTKCLCQVTAHTGEAGACGCLTATWRLQVITDMSKSIGGKPWYKINTGYYQNINGQRVAVKPGATYKGYAAVPNNGLCWQARHILLLVKPGLYVMVRGEHARRACLSGDNPAQAARCGRLP